MSPIRMSSHDLRRFPIALLAALTALVSMPVAVIAAPEPAAAQAPAETPKAKAATAPAKTTGPAKKGVTIEGVTEYTLDMA